MGGVASVLKLINRGDKHKCIISNLELFEDEMVRLSSGKWIGKKFFKATVRKDNPGRSKYRKGAGWFKAN